MDRYSQSYGQASFDFKTRHLIITDICRKHVGKSPTVSSHNRVTTDHMSLTCRADMCQHVANMSPCWHFETILPTRHRRHFQLRLEGTAPTSVFATREAAVSFLYHRPPRLWGWDIASISLQIQQWIKCRGAKANRGLNIEVSQNIVTRFLLSNILICCWPFVHIVEVENDDPSLD